MSTALPKTLLIIEDDTLLRDTMAETSRSMGYEVMSCSSAAEAMRLAAEFRPTVIICDVHLDPGDGRRVLTELRKDDSMGDCQFVLMTGDWVGASQRESIDLAADAYLPKPFTLQEYVDCVQERFTQANL